MQAMLDLLRCPVCKGALKRADDVLQCPRCSTFYHIIDDIPNMIPAFLEQNIKAMVDSWGNLGWDYDEYISRTAPERLQAIDGPLLAQCTDGAMVLEIGCGTARLKKPVEEAGSRYLGLDPSLQLLRQGLRRGENDLVCGVGEYLPFPDGYFDTIIGGYHSFRYIELAKLFPECARVLKPGGKLAFTLWNNWSLFLHSLAVSVRNLKASRFEFSTENCNDVVWPGKEVNRLERFGFDVESILSTRKVPLAQKPPFLNSVLNWRSHWKGTLGALIGYDIIFICKKCSMNQ